MNINRIRLGNLFEMTESENAKIRCIVAQEPSTPPEILAKLAEDENLEVRERIVFNSSTPPEILAKLAEDENLGIKKIAKHIFALR